MKKTAKKPSTAVKGPRRNSGGFPHNGKQHRRDQAVVAMLTEGTLQQAARTAGISETTLKRWRRDPKFAEQYRQTKRELLDGAVDKLKLEMVSAVDTLAKIMKDTKAPTAARVTAAGKILELGFHAHEIEELTARLEKLEKEMKP